MSWMTAAVPPTAWSWRSPAADCGTSSAPALASLGAVIDGQPLWSGDLALRCELRFYDDPDLDPAGIVGLEGNVIWRPSATTTLALTATSGLSETSIAGES